MPDPTDILFMQRAIDLAAHGRGRVEPNPMVGCVIVKNDRVIGEGYHQQFGGPHAEPNALLACTESPRGATAYVTLEPCCHLGKKTSPCVPRLIEAGIDRVVVGTLDPNPLVNGGGIRQLQGAGIAVTTGVLQSEARQLIAPFFAKTVEDRPYVTLKWAQTADRKIAGPHGKRLQISNSRSAEAVHQLRARSDAILVGINTVLCDDPLLTSRGVPFPRPLQRFVLDTELRIPLDSQLVRTASQYPLIVCTYEASLHANAAKVRSLEQAHVELWKLSLNSHRHVSLAPLFGLMRGVTHLLVEPGPRLAHGFIEPGLVDRLWIIQSANAINETTALSAANVPDRYLCVAAHDLDGDALNEYLNPASGAFFAATASADFRML